MNELLDTVLKAVSEKKADNIRVYDMASVTPFMDKMVIASTNNLRMNGSVVQNLKDRLKEAGYDGVFRLEGNNTSKWALVDLGDVVIHLFVREERDFYGLDKMYADVYERTYDDV